MGSLVVKYGEKIVPTRAPRTNGLDLDKNFRRLSRSSLIKGARINDGNFPTNPPSIDRIRLIRISFPHFLSLYSSGSSGLGNTKNIGRCRRRLSSYCNFVSSCSRISTVIPTRMRVGLNFLFSRRELSNQKETEEKSILP